MERLIAERTADPHQPIIDYLNNGGLNKELNSEHPLIVDLLLLYPYACVLGADQLAVTRENIDVQFSDCDGYEGVEI